MKPPKEEQAKRDLIKKHLGGNTPEWIVDNCVRMLNEIEGKERKPPYKENGCTTTCWGCLDGKKCCIENKCLDGKF